MLPMYDEIVGNSIKQSMGVAWYWLSFRSGHAAKLIAQRRWCGGLVLWCR
jgi:hypothetical protein